MKTDTKSQIDKFRRAARELECDDDEDRFKETIRRIAQPQGKKGARRCASSPKGES